MIGEYSTNQNSLDTPKENSTLVDKIEETAKVDKTPEPEKSRLYHLLERIVEVISFPTPIDPHYQN